jgi:ubiquinone/menaquinone biosynthesis C-methylase UbiE
VVTLISNSRCEPTVDGDASSAASYAQERLLSALYAQRMVVSQYARLRGLTVAERRVVAMYDDAIRGSDVLELGVGAGRVAIEIAPISRRYVGIDSSPRMVAACRERCRTGEYQLGDMRDLSRFADASFQVVLATANVLDAVSHADRLATLTQLRRVLAPGGLLIASSHNRAHTADRVPHVTLVANPLRLVRDAVSYPFSVVNWRRNRHLELEADEYAIRNDSGHHYRVLHYHIAREAQVAQLAAAGFAVYACVLRNGELVPTSGPHRDDSSPDVYYVASRTG